MVGGLLGLLMAACGGRLIDAGQQGHAGSSNAGGSSPGTSSAGTSGTAASTGGNANAGASVAGESAGGAAPACLGDGFLLCAASCGSPAAESVIGECVAGVWRCPAPYIDPDSCPDEACVRQGVRCCNHQFGTTSPPECGPDGLFAPCPVGFERNAPLCVADSAHTVNCGTLQGQSCSLEEAMCEAQGAHCRCFATDGGLSWNCVYDVL